MKKAGWGDAPAGKGPMDPQLYLSGKTLEDFSDPLLVCGPILFMLIPILLAAHFLLRNRIAFVRKFDPVALGASWLIGSLVFLWMFYTPYYQWLSD